MAPRHSLIVYADMKGATSFVASSAGLLLGLADRIHAALHRAYPEVGLPEPQAADYGSAEQAQREFDRLCERVHNLLSDSILILALDEFEAIEEAVEERKVGKEIYQYLRSKTQEPWLTLVFGGLHTLDEMSRNYQDPFFGSYENIPVSYLSRAAAWQLITNPSDAFQLNYEREAVEHIFGSRSSRSPTALV